MTETLGPYELLRLLGKGGMGEVHLARDTRLQRDVALKLLPPDLAEDPERRARFLREARAAAALNHPNITTILDVGEAAGRDYIAQEYCDGRPLSELLAGRRLPIDELVGLAAPLADALSYAHEQGVVHRDLKPANVIVTGRGHAKLLDFGLAKLLDDGDASAGREASTTLTMTGAVFGTPSAMSPEQALGRTVNGRSDVFSFGALLYEMAAGRPAFLGDTIQETINRVVNAEPEPLERVRRDAPDELVRIVTRALRKDPGERYPSMADLAADLRHLQRQTESGLQPAAAGSRRPVVPLVIAGLVIAAAVVLALGPWLRDGAPAASPTADALQSVAVLPLVNLGDAAEDEYFSDGMTEAILNALAKVDGLRVAARSSCFHFKGKDVALAEVGRLLGVDHVLEGTVQRSGDQLRLNASLVEVPGGFQVWSERYARTTGDVFGLQDEVASAIATELRLALGGDPLVEAPTRDLEAYDLYLKGRFHWEQRGSSLWQAQRFFEEALARDEDFAEAWAGLADTLSLLANWSLAPSLEVLPDAREAAERALALDPDLAAAHTAMGFVHEIYDWDADAAEERYLRALELDPDSVQTRYWYGLSLAIFQHRGDDAMEQFRIARELDPLGLLPLAFQGLGCYNLRRFDEAEELLELALERHPRSAVPLLFLSRVYMVTERWQQAETLLTRALAFDERVGWRDLAYVRARLGDPTLARQRYEEMKALGDAATGHTMLLPLALGLMDEAIDEAERFVRRRDDVRNLRDPRYDPLREDPRYRALLAEIWDEEG